MEVWGLVVSVPATRSARPRFESRPGTSPQSGLRGGRSLCECCTNKLKLNPGKSKRKKKNQNNLLINKAAQ